MYAAWFDWFAGWQDGPGQLVVDDAALLPTVMSGEWGHLPGGLVVADPVGPRLRLADGRELHIRPYREVRLLPVDAATVATVDSDDVPHLLFDLEQIRRNGQVAPYLTDPRVQVADLIDLGWPGGAAGPRTRSRVRSDGTLTCGPHGPVLGTLDDPVDLVVERWRVARDRDPAPDDPRTDRLSVLHDRPWLGRLWTAVMGIRLVRAHLGVRTSVTGLEPVVDVRRWPSIHPAQPFSVVFDDALWSVDLSTGRVGPGSRTVGDQALVVALA